MRVSRALLSTALCSSVALAAPPIGDARAPRAQNPELQDIFPISEEIPPELNGTKSAVETIISNLEHSAQDGQPLQLLGGVQDLLDFLSSIADGGLDQLGLLGYVAEISELVPPFVVDLIYGFVDEKTNSADNKHDREPDQPVYPSKSPEDAPYSLDEEQLRSAIYIPEEFEYCANGKKPLIFVPGTAVPAGTTFDFAFANHFKEGSDDKDLADPLWLNIPDVSLQDVQVNSEYVAYAINYVSGICGCAPVTVLTFSQGGFNTQWALKYWPSTHEVVEDFIAVSPDFGGSVVALGVCPPGLPVSVTCVTSFKQQIADSDLIEALAADGGRQAYVPTTTIYSATDEIVQPQSGPHASAKLEPRKGVPVTNNLVQEVCPLQNAGSVYTHELTLVNPVTWALIKDAIKNPGPGDVSHIDGLKLEACNMLLAPEIGLDEALGTGVGLLIIAVANILRSSSKTAVEPPIKDYAL